jgi:hypothetical protein
MCQQRLYSRAIGVLNKLSDGMNRSRNNSSNNNNNNDNDEEEEEERPGKYLFCLLFNDAVSSLDYRMAKKLVRCTLKYDINFFITF